MSIDSAFGVYAQSLLLHEKRAEMLANNLVNASTPAFKARDIDFHKALRDAQEQKSFDLDRADANYGYDRAALQPALDGNTVDPDIEQTKFAENAVAYQTDLKFVKDKARSILLAIRGE